MKKSSNKRWLKEHFTDLYVRRSKQEGFRARSIYKLAEINDKYSLVGRGMVVVDLGAAPGGWSEYLVTAVGKTGQIFALDVLPMVPIQGVKIIRGDFFENEIAEYLQQFIGTKIDVVLSDIAPNLTGVKQVDQLKSMELVNKAFEFATRTLKSGGSFLVKVFHGDNFNNFLGILRNSFYDVKIIKPKSSRSRSSEVFLLARNFKSDVGDRGNVK